MNASDKIPAVMNVIGAPRKVTGTSASATRSRSAANSVSASPKPSAAPVQLGDAALRHVHELVVGPELDRVGRARLRARGLEAVLHPVVAERALRGAPVDLVAVHDAEGARRDAVPAAVADVGLQDHGVELGPDQRAGRARVEAARVGAVLTDIGRHQPVGLRARVARAGPLDVSPED